MTKNCARAAQCNWRTIFVFDQRIALAGAQPREVFLQVLEQAKLKANAEEIEQDDAAVCNDETCDIPPHKQS